MQPMALAGCDFASRARRRKRSDRGSPCSPRSAAGNLACRRALPTWRNAPPPDVSAGQSSVQYVVNTVVLVKRKERRVAPLFGAPLPHAWRNIVAFVAKSRRCRFSFFGGCADALIRRRPLESSG